MLAPPLRINFTLPAVPVEFHSLLSNSTGSLLIAPPPPPHHINLKKLDPWRKHAYNYIALETLIISTCIYHPHLDSWPKMILCFRVGDSLTLTMTLS